MTHSDCRAATDHSTSARYNEQQQQRAVKSTEDVKDGDEPEYPQGLRMAAIVASLFASIFIVAVSLGSFVLDVRRIRDGTSGGLVA